MSDQAGPLRFKYWPFGIVPRPGEQLVWADRSALKTQVERLGRRLGKREAVSLHLLWADFGAGKTHTLLYLKQLADAGDFGSLLALYCALPKGCKSFLDIYRALVRAIPQQVLRDAYETAVKKVGHAHLNSTLSAIWSNLQRCFQTIAIGNDVQQLTAIAWLQAESGIPTRELQALTLFGRIRSTDDAVLALCGIVRLFNLAGHTRVLLMVDEFQRVEVLRRNQQDDINAGLHGFFNAAASGVSLLLSFSFGVEENIKHFLNPELLSRVDPLRISIPTLSREEGAEFLQEIIHQARESNDHWPISSAVIPAITDAVGARFKLTPRRLLKAAGLVFELGAMDLEDGVMSEITPAYVKQMEARGDFVRIDDQEDEDRAGS